MECPFRLQSIVRKLRKVCAALSTRMLTSTMNLALFFLFEFKTVTYLHIIRIYTPIRTADCAYYASAHIPHMRKVCVTSTFIAVEGADEILSEDLSLLTRPQTKVNYFSRHFRRGEVCRRGERKRSVRYTNLHTYHTWK